MKNIDQTMEQTDIYIGKRIEFNGHKGTVLYYGTVESTQGTWLGVEWDDPTRGKHNGSHNGIHYFKTRHPTSGSFVRPDKVNFGITFIDAFKERYVNVKDEVDPSLFILPQKGHVTRQIELVGFKQFKVELSNLHELCLSNQCISTASHSDEEWSLLDGNAVTSLNLSNNLLSSWREVAIICTHMPQLKELVLSSNKLCLPKNIHEYKSAFLCVSQLALNKIGYDWSQIEKCLSLFPSLCHLDVSFNQIVQLDTSNLPKSFALSSLDLSHNPIQSWKEIVKLGSLPCLKVLHLESINLKEIEIPVLEPPIFPELHTLYLRNNLLSSWKDVAQLFRLPKLEVLTIGNNPVWNSESPETSRQLVIAKLPSLKWLNKIEITKIERRGAEIDYLKRFCKDWLKAGGSRDVINGSLSTEFQQEHPTFVLLLKEYGAPEDSELQSKPKVLKDNLLTVEIFSPLLPNPPLTKQLPGTMSIGKVKALVRRLLKIRHVNIKLSYIGTKEDDPEIEMDNDLKELSFYSISNGDKISVKW